MLYKIVYALQKKGLNLATNVLQKTEYISDFFYNLYILRLGAAPPNPSVLGTGSQMPS